MTLCPLGKDMHHKIWHLNDGVWLRKWTSQSVAHRPSMPEKSTTYLNTRFVLCFFDYMNMTWLNVFGLVKSIACLNQYINFQEVEYFLVELCRKWSYLLGHTSNNLVLMSNKICNGINSLPLCFHGFSWPIASLNLHWTKFSHKTDGQLQRKYMCICLGIGNGCLLIYCFREKWCKSLVLSRSRHFFPSNRLSWSALTSFHSPTGPFSHKLSQWQIQFTCLEFLSYSHHYVRLKHFIQAASLSH